MKGAVPSGVSFSGKILWLPSLPEIFPRPLFHFFSQQGKTRDDLLFQLVAGFEEAGLPVRPNHPWENWDLEVGDDAFSVTLSFGDVPEHLGVPFDAVVAFADPSVRFGLQFDVGDGAKPDEAEEPAGATETADGEEEASEKVVTLDTFRKKST